MQIRLETVGIIGKKINTVKNILENSFYCHWIHQIKSGLIDKKVSNVGLPCFPGD